MTIIYSTDSTAQQGTAAYGKHSRKPILPVNSTAQQSVWLTPAYVSPMPLSECATLERDARNNNTATSIIAYCPITGIQHSIDCTASPLVSSTAHKPKQALPVAHPMLYAPLSPKTESGLTLQWQVWRVCYRLMQLNLLTIDAPISISLESASIVHRATIMQAKLLAIANAPSERIALLPAYRISANSSIDSLAVWALRSYALLYTGYNILNSASDDAMLAELDAMQTSEQHIRSVNSAIAERNERLMDAKIKAARHAAIRSMEKISLAIACETVDHVMRKTKCGWQSTIHGCKLELIAQRQCSLDITWLTLLSNLLIDNFPDAKLVGANAYACYMLVQQRIDLLALQATEALRDLGIGTDALDAYEAQAATIAARYSRVDTTILSNNELNAKLSTTVQQVSGSAHAMNTAKALEKAVVHTLTVQRTASESVSNGNLDSLDSGNAGKPQLSIAQRIAAAKAIAKSRNIAQ